MRRFQDARGLRVDGICGAHTWAALVEAGWSLGDRLLYHRTPPLRGDDVAELQRRLGALGFDTGRVDGIFGIRTGRALQDFQRNAGLTSDGICGPSTLAALRRLGSRVTGDSAASLREREARRRGPRTLAGRRVAVGHPGGLDALADAVVRALADAGALAFPLADTDDSSLAAQANALGVDLYLGLVPAPQAACTAAYYGTAGFVSEAGQELAAALADVVPAVLGGSAGEARAMAIPALRETRMPAVVLEVGPLPAVVTHTAELAATIAAAVAAWAEAPDQV